MNGTVEEYVPPNIPTLDPADIEYSEENIQHQEVETGDHSYRLIDLAYARSGDKGNNCNIGM